MSKGRFILGMVVGAAGALLGSHYIKKHGCIDKFKDKAKKVEHETEEYINKKYSCSYDFDKILNDFMNLNKKDKCDYEEYDENKDKAECKCGCSEGGCSEGGCSEGGCSEGGCSEGGCSEGGCSEGGCNLNENKDTMDDTKTNSEDTKNE